MVALDVVETVGLAPPVVLVDVVLSVVWVWLGAVVVVDGLVKVGTVCVEVVVVLVVVLRFGRAGFVGTTGAELTHWLLASDWILLTPCCRFAISVELTPFSAFSALRSCAIDRFASPQ